jgi:SecD/SecF fusion protein
MAIRNGFSRAMSAIIDANVTTIIVGLALYAFATEQVKGFAVTLILGIITSMFTAIFVSKLMFDIAERRGWLRQIRMLHLFPNPNIDFLKYRYAAISVSLVVIAIGLVAVFARGDRLYDIDFTGGSSVTFTLRDDSRMTQAEVHDALAETDLGDKNLLVVERGTTNTEFTVDTSEQSVDTVKGFVTERLGDRLMKFSVDVRDVKTYTEGEFSGSDAIVVVNSGPGYENNDGISHDALSDRVREQLSNSDHPGVQPTLSNDFYRAGSGSIARHKEWKVRLPGLNAAEAERVLQGLETSMEAEPLFPLASTIGSRVSGDMKTAAVLAIFVSLIGIIVYLWLRFQNVTYGLAASVAVVHDVLVTLGFIALSYYVVYSIPGLASMLLIDSFQVNLTIVAALLTIMGYSLNDTIVTFDRLREVKGKSPQLTAEMVNKSVNQTLGRTILTATTVFIVVVILYSFGGEGIHGFAFAFLVGVIFGCYSSIYIAAPILLWLSGSSASATMSRPSVAMKPSTAAR